MTGQQGGGAPGQPGGSPPQDQESTQVGMPVPPATPAYSQQPQQPQQPPTYGQAPGYPPPPPGYGGQPPAYGSQPPTYGGPPPGGYPPAGYGAQTPPPQRGGPSMLVVGAIALALVLVLGVGGMYALGVGPFKPAATPTAAAQATPTPKPTKTPATATATPTEAGASPTASSAPETTAPATAPPTAPPTAAATTPGFTFPVPSFSIPAFSPGPSPSMTDADTALLQHVPEALRDGCSPGAAVTPAIASLTCFTGLDTGIFVYYTSYPDANSMNQAYQGYVLVYGDNPGSDTCENADNWPAEGGYTINQVESGRLLCSGFGESPAMFWTDDRLNILSWSWAFGDVTRDDMWSFWTDEAGPIE